MADVLAEICDRKREHVAVRKRAMPEAQLRQHLSNAPPPRGYYAQQPAFPPQPPPVQYGVRPDGY